MQLLMVSRVGTSNKEGGLSSNAWWTSPFKGTRLSTYILSCVDVTSFKNPIAYSQIKVLIIFLSFVNAELKAFLAAKGIRFVPTHPYTPEENALVEKLNGLLVNKMRAAMHAAGLPTLMWPEVLPYIVDIDNMIATRALREKTPFETLIGRKPDVSKIKVCGSVGFVHVPKERKKRS